MARSDLIINLVRSKAREDDRLFKQTVDAIVAEERMKQHHALANQIIAASQEIQRHAAAIPSPRADLSLQQLFHETTPTKRLSDLVLSDEICKVVEDFVQEHLRKDLLRSYNLEPRHRVLLTGAPGNGKTSLAEAIAESIGVPLVAIRYDGLITSFLGETNQRLKQVFEYVRHRQCVLFFDEFDTVGKERGDIHETGEIKRVVSSLLLQIDSLPSHVIVIAASNHPELLDRAVNRRFQVLLDLGLPDENQILKLMEIYQTRMNLPFGDLSKPLAKGLRGLSFSALENFALSAARKHVLSLPDSKPEKIIKDNLANYLKQKRVNRSPRNAGR